MAKFNEHKNWNHWNVSLWINNDAGLYYRAVHLCRTVGKARAAEMLLQELPDATPDGAPYYKSAVRAALVGM